MAKTLCFWAVRPPRSAFVRSFVPAFVRADLVYLMICSSNSDETYREYPAAPIDDLIRFWGSKVKVTAGCRSIHVDASRSSSSSSILNNGMTCDAVFRQNSLTTFVFLRNLISVVQVASIDRHFVPHCYFFISVIQYHFLKFC